MKGKKEEANGKLKACYLLLNALFLIQIALFSLHKKRRAFYSTHPLVRGMGIDSPHLWPRKSD